MIPELKLATFLSTAPISTRGVSQEAQFVCKQIDYGWERLRKSQSLGSRIDKSIEDLLEVVNGCKEANWDGNDAAPITEETFWNAYRCLESLPFGISAPSIGCEPDGHLTFEWHKNLNRTLSVSVSPEGDLHYSAILGPNRARGTEVFLDQFPKSILDLVLRVTNS